MTPWHLHLVLLPVLLPLVTGAVLLFVDERRRVLNAAITLPAVLLLLAGAAALVQLTDRQAAVVYALGNWPAPYGIVLVADRLSAALVLLTAVLALAALLFALARWDRAGPRFHTLLQFMVAGVNGAFLTGDLFNLFVFFELLLAASYALALHGSGASRVQASLHYIVVNLTASLLFLIGAALIYAVTGTLNMADLAQRIPALPGEDRMLLEAGAAALGMAFLIKAGMWPLCFWLPRAYGAASAPAAALFAILTKVGIYAVLRVWLLCFDGDSAASTSFGANWLVVGGLATLAFGAIGVFGAQELSRLAAFSLIASSGTLLAAMGAGQAAVSGAALYYLLGSTLGLSALFLLIELVERGRAPGAGLLAVTAEAFGSFEEEDDAADVGAPIPATWAVLGLSFVACVLMLAGLPPLAGFVGKIAILDALLAAPSIAPAAWIMLALLMFGGLATVVAASRTGVTIFWAPERPVAPRVSALEITPVLLLLAACLALTVQAGPVMRYLDAAALSLYGAGGVSAEVPR